MHINTKRFAQCHETFVIIKLIVPPRTLPRANHVLLDMQLQFRELSYHTDLNPNHSAYRESLDILTPTKLGNVHYAANILHHSNHSFEVLLLALYTVLF